MVIWARFESEFCDLSDGSRSVDEQSLEEINVNEAMLFFMILSSTFKWQNVFKFLNRSLNTLTKAHSIQNRSWKRKCQQIILQMKAVQSCIHFSSPTVKILLRETHNSLQSSKGILVPRCWREATSFLKNSPKLLLLSFDRICSVTDNCLFALCWKWKNITFNHLGQIA